MDHPAPESWARSRPEYLSLHERRPPAADQENALSGRFIIRKRPATLVPPVDWRQDPYGDRSWRYWLHSLICLEPLLQRYHNSRDQVPLRRALELALDWIRSNPQGDSSVSEFAWYDMAVGARAAYIAYLLRAGAYEGVLSSTEESALRDSTVEHGRWLASAENYMHNHNHGLYADAGLFICATQLPFLEEAHGWRELANRRFLSTLRATVQWEEALHLEHSPVYHTSIHSLVERLRRVGVGYEDVDDLLTRMRDSAGWLVAPSGEFPQFGDTDLISAPKWARDAAEAKRGLKTFPKSGYAIVRTQDGYLAATCAYHGRAHKHADELTFCWYESGEWLVVDTGKYGYYYDDPGRRFAESGRAHNALVVEGVEFARTNLPPYGSGLTAAGSGGGWYAIEGHNPLLRDLAAEHTRLWLYRPAAWLIVLDRFTAAQQHRIIRFVHFAPHLRLTARGPGVYLLEGERIQLWTADCSITQPVNASVIRGQREPEVQGFTFPADREWKENPVVQYETVAKSAVLVTAFRVGASSTSCMSREDVRVEPQNDGLTVHLRADGQAETVIARKRGGLIELSVSQ